MPKNQITDCSTFVNFPEVPTKVFVVFELFCVHRKTVFEIISLFVARLCTGILKKVYEVEPWALRRTTGSL